MPRSIPAIDSTDATVALGLPIPDAAIAVGVSTSTLNRVIRNGDLEAVRIGSRTVIPWAALKAWFAKQPKRCGPSPLPCTVDGSAAKGRTAHAKAEAKAKSMRGKAA
jgi:excisionase family DNA binding protein